MDVRAKLEQIRDAVATARAMPMSASCVLNRTELLESLDELAQLLPQAFGESDRVLAERDDVLAEARAEGQQIVASAERLREDLVSDSPIYFLARDEAERLRSESQEEAAALRRETDDYMDERLANFELTLAKTLEAVQRGRDRLRGRSELGMLGGGDTDLIVLPEHKE